MFSTYNNKRFEKGPDGLFRAGCKSIARSEIASNCRGCPSRHLYINRTHPPQKIWIIGIIRPSACLFYQKNAIKLFLADKIAILVLRFHCLGKCRSFSFFIIFLLGS